VSRLLARLCVLVGLVPAAAWAAGGTPDTLAAADSTRARRVVREFATLEVRALLHDLKSGETVHPIAALALHAYPVDGLAQAVALEPGVVVQGEELHVRGGRAGETLVQLDGVTLNEPLRHRPMELPLLAVRSADLVCGAPEARYPGSLAGILDLHTVDPGPHAGGELRWQTDGGRDTRYDRISARATTPLAILGLGIVAAGDATLDDTSLPALRSHARHHVAGLSLGWRAENRLLASFKLAPIAAPQAFALQVLASRKVHEPYDPAWSVDGWVGPDSVGDLVVRPTAQPGFVRYRAADHLPMSDDRQLATLLTAARARGRRRATLALGWLRTRTRLTLGGGEALGGASPGAVYDRDATGDPFHVYRGDFPLSRVSGSDVVSVRADAEPLTTTGNTVKLGAGWSYEDVRMDELDLALAGAPLDARRAYHAWAPGGFAYGQGRWQSAGLVLNGGLRAAYYTAGPRATRQTLPGSRRGTVQMSPRLAITYPLSPRDVLSMSYARLQQDPERDLLYDSRTAISHRQPLGNPALRPAMTRAYEAAVKHLLRADWALQTSFFYHDLAQVAGAREFALPGGATDLRYADDDQGSAAGFELSVIHVAGERGRLEAHYTFMHAWGFESRPEGDPYGPVRDVRTAPIGEEPLSWDRRHSLLVAGAWAWPRLTLSWSSQVGSGLPWTPKPRRQALADVTLVNSRRFGWTETTNLDLHWSPPLALGLQVGLEARNLFGTRGERAATVDGYPNPLINTVFDDDGAYRTETGLGGGAYWTNAGPTPHWVPLHDPRLYDPPRTVRMSVGRSW